MSTADKALYVVAACAYGALTSLGMNALGAYTHPLTAVLTIAEQGVYGYILGRALRRALTHDQLTR